MPGMNAEKCRRFCFSLRTLFVLTTMAAIACPITIRAVKRWQEPVKQTPPIVRDEIVHANYWNAYWKDHQKREQLSSAAQAPER